MRLVPLLFFLATISATCHGSDHGLSNQNFPLKLKSDLGCHYIPEVSCRSWRLGVEAHNIIDWETIPKECECYVGKYMFGRQYKEDSKVVAREAFLYTKSLKLSGDGKDVWVFDIDETSLSNLPYFAVHGFGPAGSGAAVWGDLAIAPPLPESLKLYRELLRLGFKIVFLTGRGESQRDKTVKNLMLAGFHTWEKLILKDPLEYKGKSAVIYKSSERKKLEEKGYRIVGNIGDQWSDILGSNTGNRTFKLPNPAYYII